MTICFLLIWFTIVCQKMPCNLLFSTSTICYWYLFDCQLHSFQYRALHPPSLLLHVPFQFKKIYLLLSTILFFFNEYNTHLLLITFSRNDRMSEILMQFPFSIPQLSHRLICIADSFLMLNHIPLKFPPSDISFLH